MKRIISLLLIFLFCLSCSGCHKSSENTSQFSSESVSGQSDSSVQFPSDGQASFDQKTVSSKPLETVRIMFSEGMTMPKMFGILEEKGAADEDALFDAAAKHDFSEFSLINDISMPPSRCYRLEGYLFPDTYDFFIGENPDSILKKMIKNTQLRIKDEYIIRADEIGMSIDDVINLASVIQKEAGTVSEMAKVSSVLHNRMKKGIKLQCDATITYVEYVIKPFISGDINRYNSYYNTYKCKALPAGPICNPGTAAIEAALWPEETTYYYFAMDKQGNHYYAQTYEEHVSNCIEAGINV